MFGKLAALFAVFALAHANPVPEDDPVDSPWVCSLTKLTFDERSCRHAWGLTVRGVTFDNEDTVADFWYNDWEVTLDNPAVSPSSGIHMGVLSGLASTDNELSVTFAVPTTVIEFDYIMSTVAATDIEITVYDSDGNELDNVNPTLSQNSDCGATTCQRTYHYSYEGHPASSFTVENSLTDGTTRWALDNLVYCFPGGGGGQDPHFVGFDGSQFDAKVEAGKTYSIVSDQFLQFNAGFQASCHSDKATVMSDAAVQFAGHRIAFSAAGDAIVDGKRLEIGDTVQLFDANDDYVELIEGAKHMPLLRINTFDYLINLQVAKSKKCGNNRLDFTVVATNARSRPNGILGQTLAVPGQHKRQAFGEKRAVKTPSSAFETKSLFDNDFEHNKFTREMPFEGDFDDVKLARNAHVLHEANDLSWSELAHPHHHENKAHRSNQEGVNHLHTLEALTRAKEFARAARNGM